MQQIGLETPLEFRALDVQPAGLAVHGFIDVRHVEVLHLLEDGAQSLVAPPVVAGARWLGRDAQPPVEVDPKDRRFAAPAWEGNPAYYSIRLGYLATAKAARDVIGSAQMDPDQKEKALMALGLLVDALAPTNFLPTNPAALQRAFDTAVLLDGLRVRDASDINGAMVPFWPDLVPNDLDRVEVLRGSGSSIYGTNAIGGVINLVRKQTCEQHSQMTAKRMPNNAHISLCMRLRQFG